MSSSFLSAEPVATTATSRSASRATQLPALTGVRGVAAAWVVLFHSKGILYQATGLTDLALLEMGWFGVDIFFLLSGFILCHVHLNEFESLRWKTTQSFIFLRLSRIYPVHLFSLGVVLAFFLLTIALGKPATGRPRFEPELFVGNLFLVHSWGWANNDSWNILSWSISTEWFMYLLFPLLALLLGRVRSTLAAVAGVAIAIGGEILVLRWLGLHDTFTTWQWGLVRTFFSFVAGCFLYLAFRSGRLDDLPWWWIELGCGAWLLIAILGLRSPFAALPAVAGLILSLAMSKGPISRFCAARPAYILGEVSYSLYMMHMITLEIVFLPLDYSRYGTLTGPLVLVWYAVALAVIAYVTFWTYTHVERPSRIWLRNRIGR